MAEEAASPATQAGGLDEGQAGGSGATYPPAAASQEEVVQDRALFLQTLQRLHEDLGTQFRVPQVAGKELDLHLLYRQVTGLGGLEAVIAAKKWTEVAEPFQFPTSFTSKSFTLRKMYTKLLHDYEQVYFHHNTGLLVVPPGAETQKGDGHAPSSTPSKPLAKKARTATPAASANPGQPAMPLQSVVIPPPQPPALTSWAEQMGSPAAVGGEGLLVGSQLSGTIDAKFDCGYFVSLYAAGGQTFKGVLYCAHGGQQLAEDVQHSLMHTSQAALAHHLPASPEVEQAPAPSGKKVKPEKKDPNKPKHNRTPFNFYSAEARAQVKAELPDADQKEISKRVGEMWQKLTPEQRAPYVAASREEKVRYDQAMLGYRQAARQAQQEAEEHAAAQAATHAALAAARAAALARAAELSAGYDSHLHPSMAHSGAEISGHHGLGGASAAQAMEEDMSAQHAETASQQTGLMQQMLDAVSAQDPGAFSRAAFVAGELNHYQHHIPQREDRQQEDVPTGDYP